MNPKVHYPTRECHDDHCAYHNVDEPIGVYTCGECLHSWPSWEELIMDHNTTVIDLDLHDLTIRFEDSAAEIWICPLCAHSF